MLATVTIAGGSECADTAGRLVNRLEAEPSPYLRSLASSPVAWQAWGEPALRLARELGRPILLSIGADWCHWCHVMDRETYADPAVAALVNAHFVAIKVDRDDRPDVDARFQDVARRALDTVGWPLTLFLTADGRVVSGGATFFPDARDGVPGFRGLLPRVVALVGERGIDAREAAVPALRLIAQGPTAGSETGRPDGGGGHALAPLPSPGLAGHVLDAGRVELDVIHGGLGHGAKRVPGALLALAARRHAETGDVRALEVLTRTLDAMARTAIRDHLGGGFFRDTADRAWRRPRGEQLDAIQAQVIVAYLLGYQATGAPRYRAIVEETLAFTDRGLARPGGGFHAGRKEDADQFRWSEADVRAALPAAEAELIVRHFGLGGGAERRALAIDVTAEELAAAAGVTPQAMHGRLTAAKDRLRASRGEPAVDPTVYAGRSALLASAYLEAYKVLGGDARLRVALDTLDFLWTRLRQPDGGMGHAFRDGRVIAAGLLDDQLSVAAAFLDAFEVTGLARHLDAARTLAAHAVARFRSADGGFVDAPGAPEASRLRFEDGEWPGGNALAALVLDRLHELTNEAPYRSLAGEALSALPGAARPPGPRHAAYAYAADVHVNGALHVVIVGQAPDARTRALWRGALRAYRPGKIVTGYDPAVIDAAAVPPAVAAMLRQTAGAEPRAYVCSNNLCSLPQTDPERVRELVETLGGGRRPHQIRSAPAKRRSNGAASKECFTENST